MCHSWIRIRSQNHFKPQAYLTLNISLNSSNGTRTSIFLTNWDKEQSNIFYNNLQSQKLNRENLLKIKSLRSYNQACSVFLKYNLAAKEITEITCLCSSTLQFVIYCVSSDMIQIKSLYSRKMNVSCSCWTVL